MRDPATRSRTTPEINSPVSISMPPKLSSALRTTARNRSSLSLQRSSPISTASTVELTMSMNITLRMRRSLSRLSRSLESLERTSRKAVASEREVAPDPHILCLPRGIGSVSEPRVLAPGRTARRHPFSPTHDPWSPGRRELRPRRSGVKLPQAIRRSGPGQRLRSTRSKFGTTPATRGSRGRRPPGKRARGCSTRSPEESHWSVAKRAR